KGRTYPSLFTLPTYFLIPLTRFKRPVTNILTKTDAERTLHALTGDLFGDRLPLHSGYVPLHRTSRACPNLHLPRNKTFCTLRQSLRQVQAFARRERPLPISST